MFDKLTHLWNVLQTSWQEDPAARGAGKMAVGAVLCFEGMFGTLRDLADGPRKKSGGLIASLTGIVMGAALIYAGAITNEAFTPNVPIDTRGVVVEHEASHSDGKTMYREIIEYRDREGQRYTLRSASSSTKPTPIGEEVDVAYSAGNPDTAQRTDGLEGTLFQYLDTALYLFGTFVLAIGLFSLAINALLIAVGVYLFGSGRRERIAAGQRSGFVNDLLSLFSQVKSGDLDIKNTAAGAPGSATETHD